LRGTTIIIILPFKNQKRFCWAKHGSALPILLLGLFFKYNIY
jgi:hypothetical protein